MKRPPQQREHDMIKTAQLYLQGLDQRRIAQEIGVSQPQIHKDLKKIKKEWLASALRDFDAARAQELAKIDHLEAKAWEAYENGERAGDPQLLKQVAWCIDRRCKLLALDAPPRKEEPDRDEPRAQVVLYMPDNGRDPHLNQHLRGDPPPAQ